MSDLEKAIYDAVKGYGITKVSVDEKDKTITFTTEKTDEHGDGYVSATVDFLEKVEKGAESIDRKIETVGEGEGAKDGDTFTIEYFEDIKLDESTDKKLEESHMDDYSAEKDYKVTYINNEGKSKRINYKPKKNTNIAGVQKELGESYKDFFKLKDIKPSGSKKVEGKVTTPKGEFEYDDLVQYEREMKDAFIDYWDNKISGADLEEIKKKMSKYLTRGNIDNCQYDASREYDNREKKTEGMEQEVTEYTITYNDMETEDEYFDNKEDADERFEELKTTGEISKVMQYFMKTWIFNEDTGDYEEDYCEVYYTEGDEITESKDVLEEEELIESESSGDYASGEELSTEQSEILEEIISAFEDGFKNNGISTDVYFEDNYGTWVDIKAGMIFDTFGFAFNDDKVSIYSGMMTAYDTSLDELLSDIERNRASLEVVKVLDTRDIYNYAQTMHALFEVEISSAEEALSVAEDLALDAKNANSFLKKNVDNVEELYNNALGKSESITEGKSYDTSYHEAEYDKVIRGDSDTYCVKVENRTAQTETKWMLVDKKYVEDMKSLENNYKGLDEGLFSAPESAYEYGKERGLYTESTEGGMTVGEFKTKVEEIYHSKFPNSMCVVSSHRGLGSPYILISLYYAKDKDSMPNGYEENDLFGIRFSVNQMEGSNSELKDEDIMPENLELETIKNRILTKPDNEYMAYGSKSVIFRKAIGNADKILSVFTKDVDKIYNTMQELISNNLIPDDREIYTESLEDEDAILDEYGLPRKLEHPYRIGYYDKAGIVQISSTHPYDMTDYSFAQCKVSDLKNGKEIWEVCDYKGNKAVGIGTANNVQEVVEMMKKLDAKKEANIDKT